MPALAAEELESEIKETQMVEESAVSPDDEPVPEPIVDENQEENESPPELESEPEKVVVADSGEVTDNAKIVVGTDAVVAAPTQPTTPQSVISSSSDSEVASKETAETVAGVATTSVDTDVVTPTATTTGTTTPTTSPVIGGTTTTTSESTTDTNTATTTDAADTTSPSTSDTNRTENEDSFNNANSKEEENNNTKKSELQSTAAKATSTGTTTATDVMIPDPVYLEYTTDVAHNDSVYQFTKQQCVPMGDGSYHCVDATAPALVDTEDPVSSRMDNDGDYEIFLSTAEETVPITDNLLDDSAPYYDPVTDTVVWQRLEGGRYTIYVWESGNETPLSTEYENSMEPSRSGAYIVWQSWIHNNWEVVLHDVRTDSSRVISNSSQHDIAPRIQGEYIIWNSVAENEQTVAVYEIATGQLATIDAEDGGRVENPRFVLVYDTKFTNGDIITKGFNTETGEIMPLGAQAPVVPLDIPSSDSTGETRALIQNKSSNKEEVDELLVPKRIDNGTTTTSESEVTAIESVNMSTSSEEVLPLTDYDLIVTPNTAVSQQGSDSATSSQKVE